MFDVINIVAAKTSETIYFDWPHFAMSLIVNSSTVTLSQYSLSLAKQ